MVYASNVTAKASTRGARLVCRTVDANCSSDALVVGSAREASMDAGVGSEPARVEDFERLAGDEVSGSPAFRFLVHRFAAARTALASFSSGKMA